VYEVLHSSKFYHTIKFQNPVLKDNVYVVLYVRAIVKLTFHKDAFKLLFCEPLQYQNYSKYPQFHDTQTRCTLLLHVADKFVGCLNPVSTAEFNT